MVMLVVTLSDVDHSIASWPAELDQKLRNPRRLARGLGDLRSKPSSVAVSEPTVAAAAYSGCRAGGAATVAGSEDVMGVGTSHEHLRGGSQRGFPGRQREHRGMRVAVIGAGAIGSVVGGLLARAGSARLELTRAGTAPPHTAIGPRTGARVAVGDCSEAGTP